MWQVRHYRLIKSGSKDNFAAGVAEAEKDVPEGGEAELRLLFNGTFPLFNQTAEALNTTLRAVSGVPPWEGNNRVVYYDEKAASYYIRWKKGFPWAPVIVAALWAIAILIIALVIWRAYHTFLAPVFQEYPFLPLLLLAVGAWLVLGGGTQSATE